VGKELFGRSPAGQAIRSNLFFVPQKRISTTIPNAKHQNQTHLMNQKNHSADNIPQLRFPEFVGEWEKKKLGEVATNKVTNSFSRENLNYEIGKVKNIHYGDIHTKFQILFDVTKENVPFINGEISIQRINEENYCIEGDLIFADASEDLNDVGKSIEIVNLNDEKLLSGLHTILVRPNPNTFQKGFAGYLFKSNNIRLQIQKESQGSKILSISGGRLLNTIISFPTLPEQTRIANFLTAVDEKIQALKKKKGLLEAYKKGVIKRLFSQELRFKCDDGQAFADWEVKKLGEVLSIPEKIKPDKIDKNKLLTVKLHLKGLFKNESTDGLSIGSTNYFVRQKGQFIYGKQNLFNGAFGIISDEFDGFLTSGDVPALNIDYSKLNPMFLVSFLGRGIFYKKLEEIASGSGSKRIHENIFFTVEIPIPCLPEQTRIANFLYAIDDKIKHNAVQIQKMEDWKKGLLQKMFV
jgi:type I restriction enzyme S subunit